MDMHTAISITLVRKHVPATIPKGNMGYGHLLYAGPDTVAVESFIVDLL